MTRNQLIVLGLIGLVTCGLVGGPLVSLLLVAALPQLAFMTLAVIGLIAVVRYMKNN